MRILVLGAGAIGGYFGGRLAEAGADVTFLVRPQRQRRLAEQGLVVKSPAGDIAPKVQTVLAGGIQAPYDVVLLTCKAYDLETALEAIAPAMGPKSVIIPMLNGLLHLDTLTRRFGRERVMGGGCYIGAMLSPEGYVIQMGDLHVLTFGEAAARARGLLTDRGSRFTASTQTDMDAGGATEGDHIVGDMVRRGEAKGVPTPLLRVALCNLQVYELKRA